MRITRLLSSATLLLLLGIAGSSAAQAYPEMVDYYPGSSCVFDGAHPENIEYWWGQARNPTTASVGMNCPVTRPVSCNGCSATARISVIDLHYSADFSCQHRAYNPNANGSYYYAGASSSGSSSAPQTLTMSTAGGNYRYVYCSVPGAYSGNRSVISGYEFYQQP